VELGALPLRDEVEHVHLQEKTESACIKAWSGWHMQTHDIDKRAMHERIRMLKQGRARSRDEKYTDSARPPDVQEPAEAVLQDEAARERGWSVVGKRGSDASDWDMVGRDEHLHSPPSSRPPCTSHTRALCTVS
jgi:hypothetical protein